MYFDVTTSKSSFTWTDGSALTFFDKIDTYVTQANNGTYMLHNNLGSMWWFGNDSVAYTVMCQQRLGTVL